MILLLRIVQSLLQLRLHQQKALWPSSLNLKNLGHKVRNNANMPFDAAAPIRRKGQSAYSLESAAEEERQAVMEILQQQQQQQQHPHRPGPAPLPIGSAHNRSMPPAISGRGSGSGSSAPGDIPGQFPNRNSLLIPTPSAAQYDVISQFPTNPHHHRSASSPFQSRRASSPSGRQGAGSKQYLQASSPEDSINFDKAYRRLSNHALAHSRGSLAGLGSSPKSPSLMGPRFTCQR